MLQIEMSGQVLELWVPRPRMRESERGLFREASSSRGVTVISRTDVSTKSICFWSGRTSAVVAEFERPHFILVPGVDLSTCRELQEVWLGAYKQQCIFFYHILSGCVVLFTEVLTVTLRSPDGPCA